MTQTWHVFGEAHSWAGCAEKHSSGTNQAQWQNESGRQTFQEGFLEEVAFEPDFQGGVQLPHFGKICKTDGA